MAGRLAVICVGLFTLAVGIILSSVPWLDYLVLKYMRHASDMDGLRDSNGVGGFVLVYIHFLDIKATKIHNKGNLDSANYK
ncbi:hypothetical protein J6590_044026 [Homalodisca vitripennis]|nr:hypothetical protein J6590_044026 [Homalodisca vitripennis]